ncbi:MAG: PTS transporter subunit EIIC, partial [Bacilli bacterium]
FAYLPIFVGMNAAKENKGTPVLGAIAGALVIVNPSMPLLVNLGKPDAVVNVLMPITNAVYNPVAGGLIAALLAGFIFALIERQIRKVMPEILDTFFTPLLTLIIGGILMVLFFQPVGKYVSDLIYNVMNFLYNDLGAFGGYILSASFLPLVSVGLHQALTPIHMMLNEPTGPTNGINYLLPILMMAGGGQVGAALALLVKTKNQRLKKLIKNSVPVGILGVGEPLMYAVTLPLGRSFLTACLGAGFGGILAVLFNLGAISQGVSGLFGLLIVEPGQQIQFAIAMIASYIGGFILTYFFGVDEERINEVYGE